MEAAPATMNKATAAVLLPARFIAAVVVAGWQTLLVIVRHGLHIGEPPRTALIRVHFSPMAPSAAALLGCIISLTPGSTVVNIDMAARKMLVHVLDSRDAPSELAAVRRDFEPPLIALFGAGS